MAARKTRLLIVDDSAVVRSLLRTVVSTDQGLEVVGTAVDGAAALRSIADTRPDLILLDVEMPVMDGLATLRELRRRGYKIPVIMCSSLTQRGATVTLEALACGASDYVAKPRGQGDRDMAIQALRHELTPKIHALTQQHEPPPQALAQQLGIGLPPALRRPPISQSVIPGLSRPQSSPAPTMQSAPPSNARPTMLAIGVSTGGPAALDILLPLLPADFPLPVLIVQHMPELFTKLFAERLDTRCKLRVFEAAEGQPVRPGMIAIAKGNWHMEVVAPRGPAPATLHLTQGPLENHCRPAVDVLFRSVASIYGAGVISLVLTGMGSDGMLGAKVIREHGGTVLAQDRATSVVCGMPGAVANAGLAHRILPLQDVAPELIRLASKAHNEAPELREIAV